MRFNHPQYGHLAGTDPHHCRGRWHVTGTSVLCGIVEHLVEEGLDAAAVVEREPGLSGKLEAVEGIVRIYRQYLARVGRPVAA